MIGLFVRGSLSRSGYVEAEQKGTLAEWMQSHSEPSTLGLQDIAPRNTGSDHTMSSGLSSTFSEDLNRFGSGAANYLPSSSAACPIQSFPGISILYHT